MANLADLPGDVVLHILELCAIEDALILTQVCICPSARPVEVIDLELLSDLQSYPLPFHYTKLLAFHGIFPTASTARSSR